MLWADDESSVPNNYFSAVVQLKSPQRRLEKTPELRASSAQTITDDFDKGYIVQVDKSDCFRIDNPREWYLPRHPVFHPHKPGKVRRVLNGAAKFHGVPLNSKHLTGPDFLQTLIHELMRFRQHPYAESADIKGLFFQVGVIPEDRPSLRFLRREDPQQTSLWTNTYVTSSVRSIRQRVPITLCNRLHVTTEPNSLKLPTV